MPKNQDSSRSQSPRTDPNTGDVTDDDTVDDNDRRGVTRTSGDVDAPQPEHAPDR